MNDQIQIDKEKKQLISSALNILQDSSKTSSVSAELILNLAQQLIKETEFGLARKILETALQQKIKTKHLKRQLIQKLSLSTYKDPHLNQKTSLDEAIQILSNEFDLANEKDQETLGLAGAIFKRKWETSGLKVDLEQSLLYYLNGFKQGVKADDGYTAINAAYILDLLANLEQKQAGSLGTTSSVANTRRKEAIKIREKIIAYLKVHIEEIALEKENYWVIVTLAEAYFGTQQYSEAKTWLSKTLKIPDLPEWEYITTAKQLVHLARIQANEHAIEKTEAWTVLQSFLGDNAGALKSLHHGKVGLALSGGGFRSSFYHIGVLAKLAELDMLRHIEVLSCVSGGSILGTHYYLELRRLINTEKKKDNQIKRKDYINLVENLVDDFLAGVQENPRVRVMANPIYNLKMIFSSSYSRTQRLGELYEKLIYSRVKDKNEEITGTDKRYLSDLYITPIEYKDKKFLPRRDNWSRQCKIPELILNSTTLNTGHNWQFTASWMGESPYQIDPDVDTNDRYRRIYYGDAPSPYDKVRLGTAVGASSCVPGLFEPLIFRGLYPDTTVRLIDGGVYDNQGVSGLLEQDCSIIISSDATGQMNTEKDPGGGILKPLLRTNTTLMQRVRDSQYQDLKERKSAGILKGFVYVHLKQGLEGKNVNWVDNKELNTPEPDPNAKTPYGIREDIQDLIAGMRTDLDSFSDIEAYALMTSGYNAIEESIKQSLTDFPLHQGSKAKWKFLKVDAAMKQDTAEGEDFNRLKTNLEASALTFGKIWQLDHRLSLVRKAGVAIFLLGLIIFCIVSPSATPFAGILTMLGNKLTLGLIVGVVLSLAIMFALTTYLGNKKGKAIKQILNYKDIPRRLFIGGGIGLIGWIGALIHRSYFDKMFKEHGKIK